MIAQAMSRKVSDFMIDSIDFEDGEIDRSANRAFGRVVSVAGSNVRGDKIKSCPMTAECVGVVWRRFISF